MDKAYLRTGESVGKAKEGIEEQLYAMHNKKSFKGVCFKKCKSRSRKGCEQCFGIPPSNYVPMD